MQVYGDTSRRSPKIFLQRMATDNPRSVGSFNNKRRSETGIFNKTSFQWNSGNKCQCPKFKNFTVGGRQIITKRCDRTCPTRENADRFLFNIFPSPEKNGRSKTSNKFATFECVSSETTFQDGQLKQGAKLSSTRRLGSFNRHERCISTCTAPCCSQKISTVLHSGEGVSVHLPLFRAKPSPKKFHENSNSGCSSPQNVKSAVSGLSRRLVSSKSNQRTAHERQTSSSQSSSQTRFHDQSRKVNTLSKSKCNIHRCSFSPAKRHCLSNSREVRENRTSNSVFETRSNCSNFPPSIGINGILHRSNTSCSPFHEANSDSSFALLETSISESPSQNSNQQISDRPSCMVAKERKSIAGENLYPYRNFESGDNRCFEDRFRRSSEQSSFSRSLVRAGEDIAHKQSRVGSSVSNSAEFSTATERSQCVDKVGLNIGSPVYQQTRGDPIIPSLLPGMEIVESGNKEQNVAESSSFSRSEKQTGGRFEQGANSSDRMDAEQCSNPENLSSLGNANDGPICIRSESQSSNVLFMAAESDSVCNRRISNLMGKHGSVCLPASDINSQGDTAHEEISLPINPDSPSVAQEELVHRSSSNADRLPDQTTSTAESAAPTQNKDLPSESPSVQSCCMAAINRSFESKGFSEEARKLLAASWRAGTQKDYAVKFNKFHSWCSEREIDPYNATLAECADFLSTLFQSGLKYRTIAGYRSMLSALLVPVDNVPVGQHPHIMRLLKGVFNSRPPQKKLVPEWDLQKVLNFLSGSNFEPLSKVSLKYLTWKTVFLVAVTTFRRCGDIQALKVEEGFMSIVQEGIIFIREGLSKQDRPGHNGSKIFVPCFCKNGSKEGCTDVCK